jgi:hybrid cluster-associated redox disulfide protein
VSKIDILTMTVSEVLEAVPGAASVFVDRAMACPGCPFAPFETVSQVAGVYEVSPSELADAIEAARVATNKGVER